MLDKQSVQIELLIGGAVFCLIAALCIFLSNNFEVQKRKWLFWLQIATALLLGGDALAYKFRGFPGSFGRSMVIVSNFTVFAMSDVILLFFHAYMCSYLFSKEMRKKLFRVKFVYGTSLLGVFLVVLSQFTNLYYYFDTDNFYHRNTAYVLAIIVPLVGMMVDFSLLVQFQKNISRKIFISMLSYVTLPPVAACIQLFFYGVSLINVSIGMSMVIMYIVFTSEQNEQVLMLLKKKMEVEERLEIATTLNRCVKELSSDTDIYTAINHLLEIINDYFQADRSYIFEINDDRNTLTNTHEYVREGVSAQKDNLQDVPLEVISTWMESFRKNQVYYISDLEQEKGFITYDMLREQEVNHLLAAPLWKKDKILGFLGVDNPKKHYDDVTLLSAIQYFVTNSLSSKKQQEQLQYLSYRDMLTKLYNRNKYMDVIADLAHKSLENTGIAYIDINGLKMVNDTQGHEAGDGLICKAAEVIFSIFPKNSYRIGGDEFVVICTDIEEQTFYRQVNRIRTQMEKKHVSISVGMLWRATGGELQDMLNEADRYMYEEKEAYYRMTGTHSR